MNHNKGYTLLEVLISIVIFSAMLLLGSVAFNQGLKNYETIAKRGIHFWENTRLLLLQRSFSSIFDYFVHDSRGRFFPYFIGRTDLISFVTNSPLSYDYPVLVVLSKEKREEGSLDLVYYEQPVFTMNYDEIERFINFKEYQKLARRVVFLSNLESITFSYYVFDQRRGLYTWVSTYEGRNGLYLPKMVKIEYQEKGANRDSLILGIYVDTTRKLFYNEIYQ